MREIQRIIFKAFLTLLVFFLVVQDRINGFFRKRGLPSRKIGYLNLEYFHEEAGGFGGYGMCAKNITGHYNANGKSFRMEMLIPRGRVATRLKRLHNTDTLLSPDPDQMGMRELLRYAGLLKARGLDLLLTTDYYPVYRHSLALLPRTPVVIWIHDPWPTDEIEKIASVSLHMRALKKESLAEFKRHAQHKEASIKKLIAMSRLCRRRVSFAFAAHFLAELGKRTYGLSDIQASFLPSPVPLPPLGGEAFSGRPSFCFLARLDPIKRPWIYFELARRFPGVDFFVAGKTNFPSVMNPILERYVGLENLHLEGLVTGEKKDALLRKVWAVVNTSVHEGLPISFLEAFSYGKPVISSVNPDGLVEKFGVYTGEILGDAFDRGTVDKFAEAVQRFLDRPEEVRRKGQAARNFVEQVYSLESFDRHFKEILGRMAG